MNHKIKLLVILFCLSSGSIMAQNIQVLMSPKPSPYITDWQQQTETVRLVITNSSAKEIEVKIKTELFDGKGALIAKTDDAKMPVLTISPTSTTTYNPEDIIPSSAVKYYGNLEKTAITTGRIPDDNYRLCVTLIDPKTGKPIGTSGTVCKVFSIVAYQAPTLIAPANKEVIKGAAIKGIVFRWSPVIPSPKTIVTYRLQVWEVLDGQNSMTALRSNMPILEKDLKGILQTQWPVDFPLPDTGRTYVWTVTPLDGEERKLVDGLGFAEPFEFKVCCTGAIPFPIPPSISLQLPADNEEVSKEVTFNWTDLGEAHKGGYTLRIVELKSGQSPEDAIAKNLSVFEQKGIMGKSFKLGDSVGKLKEGEKYVWAVRSGEIFSEPFSFIVGRDVDPKGRPGLSINLISPSEQLEPTDTRPTFKWEAEKVSEGITHTIVVREEGLKNRREEDGATMKDRKILFERSGIQSTTFDYPKEIQALDTSKVYSWEVLAYDKNKVLIGSSQLRMIIIGGGGWPICWLIICPPNQKICLGATCTLPVPVALVIGSCNPATMWYRIDIGSWMPLTATQIFIPCPTLTVGTHIITFRLNCSCGPPRICSYNIYVYPAVGMANNICSPICFGEDNEVSLAINPPNASVLWDFQDLGSSVWTNWPSPPSPANSINTNTISPAMCTPPTVFVTRRYRATVDATQWGLPPVFPAGCLNSATTDIEVRCPAVAGAITVTSSPSNHTVEPGNKICSDKDGNGSTDYNVLLNLGLIGHIGTPGIWTVSYTGTGSCNPLFNSAGTGLTTQNVTFLCPGTYTFSVTISNGSNCNGTPCASVNASFTVIIANPPAPPVITIIEHEDLPLSPYQNCPFEVCPHDDVVMTIGASHSGELIQWFYLPVTSPSSNNTCPTTGWIAAGTGFEQNSNNIGPIGSNWDHVWWKVTVQDINEICDPLEACCRINIIKPPCQPIISGTNLKCPGTPVTLTLSSASGLCGPTLTYQWYLNGSPIGIPTTSTTLTVTAPGNYHVEAIGPCEKTKSKIFVVKDHVISVSIKGDCCPKKGSVTQLCATGLSSCSTTGTYLWSNGQTTPCISVTANSTTTYTVTYTDLCGCKATSSFTITVCD